jgi:signal transduction histidine kinase
MIPSLWRASGPPRSTLIVVLLGLTVVLAGVLAFHAQAAARDQQTGERALSDYAAFAVWGFSRQASTTLAATLEDALELIQSPGPGAALLPPTRVEPGSRSPWLARAWSVVPEDGYTFRLELGNRSLQSWGASPPPAVRAWLKDTLTADAYALAAYPPRGTFAVARGVVDGQPILVAYTLQRDGGGRPVAAVGFPTRWELLAPIFEEVLEGDPLLPPSLIRGLVADSFLSVRVVDGAGREVYRSPVQYPATYSARDTLHSPFGNLTAQIALRPSVAQQLVIGGLPRSRLPLLVALLLLTGSLAGATLVQLRREMRFAQQRADWVSGVSHELRTPLAQIRLFVETLLLGRTRSEGERRRSLEIIDREANRLAHLVENVLHFSRGQRGAYRVHPHPINVASHVQEAVDAFAPLARAREVRLRTELEELVAPADADALRQVLLNLLDNAVKYGPPGQTVTVGTCLRGAHARIWVEDSGPGISPADRARIWEPFRRLDRGVETGSGGSGIGLAVVHELVALHGGRVAVEDGPGGGARFVVDLPGARPVASPVEPSLERVAV